MLKAAGEAAQQIVATPARRSARPCSPTTLTSPCPSRASSRP